MNRILVALFIAAAASASVTPDEQAAIDRISADSMRANLSYLASDALEGRNTPSKGLDLAADFIAAQFRRAGLEPAAPDGSYFQTAKFARVTPRVDDFHAVFKAGGLALDLDSNDVEVTALTALDLDDVPVVKLPADEVEDRVVLGDARIYGSEAALHALEARKPALILLWSRRGSASHRPYLAEVEDPPAPVIRVVRGDGLADLAGKAGPGSPMSLSLHLAAPGRQDFGLRNVAGILRGSDPVLRDQFVLVTAHYDHLGTMPGLGAGDRIYNGANDNGSGTVSVMEIGAALATLAVHPKRSIVFLTLFGEEEGLLGAYYYTHHPLVPLRDTIADLNLEQLGRTDEKTGKETNAFAFTGPSLSDLPARLTAAAKSEKVKVYGMADADAYFDRSDNYAFALAGVVAHTVVVAFEFPDYHGVGDEWGKIDYVNMAKVDRALAAGVLELASSPEVPAWSKAAAKRYGR